MLPSSLSRYKTSEGSYVSHTLSFQLLSMVERNSRQNNLAYSESDYNTKVNVIVWARALNEIEVVYIENESWSKLEERIKRKTGLSGRLTVDGIHPFDFHTIKSEEMSKAKRFVFLPCF